MTDVREEQELLLARAANHALAVAETPGRQGAVDAYVVAPVPQSVEGALREAEAPALLVITRAVGNPVGMLGQRVQMRPELRQAERGLYRRAVTHHVQRVGAEIDHALAARVLDPRLADVPFVGDFPIEHRGSRGHFSQLERNAFADCCERLAHAVAGNAAADRIELLHHLPG